MTGFGFGQGNDKNPLGGSGTGGGGGGTSNSNETSSEAKGALAYLDSIEKDKEQTKSGNGSWMQEAIAQGTAKGAAEDTGAQLFFNLKEIFNKKQMMFVHKHNLLSPSGLITQQSNVQEPYSYSENFNYDPIRSSIGSVWSRNFKNNIRHPLGLFGNAIAQTQTQQLIGKTQEEINELVPQDGIGINSIFLPLVKFKFDTIRYNEGITHLKLGGVLNLGDEETEGFKSPVLNMGTVQFLYLYFNLNDYLPAAKKLVPFNMLFDMRQKIEGTTVSGTGQNLELPLFDKGSSIYYNKRMFITKDSQEQLALSANSTIWPDVFKIASIDKIEQKVYEDHIFSSQAAISEETIPFFGADNLQGELVADVRPVYNYFLPEWEYATPSFPNNFIGGAYEAAYLKLFSPSTFSEQFDTNFNFSKLAYSFINCDNTVDSYKEKVSVKRRNNVVIEQSKIMADAVDNLEEQFPMYNEITFSSIPQGQLGVLFKESGMTEQFLKTLLTYVYGDYADTSADAALLKLGKILGFGLISPKILESKNTTIVSSIKEPSSVDLFEDSEMLIQAQDEMPNYNFLNWLDYYINEINKTPIDITPDNPDDPNFKLFDVSEYSKYASFWGSKKFRKQFIGSKKSSFKSIISLIKFLGGIKAIIAENHRNYHDLLSLKEAHSDLLYYRIEKRSTKTGEIIQNFFIMPQDFDPDKGFDPKVRFVDTHVKYGQSYDYEIFAVKAVVGTEYKMQIMQTSDQQPLFDANVEQDVQLNNEIISGDKITTIQDQTIDAVLDLYPLFNPSTQEADTRVMPVKVMLRPTIKIVEVPMHTEQDVIIADYPPMPPLVNMYPLNGKNNKILMTLETQTGDRELVPQPVEVEDTAYFVTERFSQKREIVYPGGEYVYPTIRFKSDDDSSSYEIYRIEGSVPTSYGSFRGKLHKSLNKMAPIPESGFEDTIQVNKKYYYLFRSRDMHGNVSNPSPIYEVEMVQASEGVFYPIINVVDIEYLEKQAMLDKDSSLSKGKRSLNKTIQIFPADQQIFVNNEESLINGETANIPDKDPVLGIADKRIWNKRFKFRFTSRHTGKSIDLNVDFTTEHVKPQEPTEACFVPEEE